MFKGFPMAMSMVRSQGGVHSSLKGPFCSASLLLSPEVYSAPLQRDPCNSWCLFAAVLRRECDPYLGHGSLWDLVVTHLHKTHKHKGSLQHTLVLFSSPSRHTCVLCPHWPMLLFLASPHRLHCPAFLPKACLSKLRDSAV